MASKERDYVVGVDIGGGATKIGIVDRRGNILAQNRIPTKFPKDPNDRSENPENEDVYSFVKRLCDAIRNLSKNVEGMSTIHGVGIGVPNGNFYKGTVEFAPNLPWNGIIPLAEYVKDEIGLPVVKLTNDANAAAMGEMKYGAAIEIKNFIMITLGTGVGSGIVIDGNMVYGHDGFAGELGHTIQFRENGRMCGCGRRGCLEAYTSATGVARSARELVENTDTPTILRDFTDDEGNRVPVSKLTSQHVDQAAKRGDQAAIGILRDAGRILGAALADFVAFSAPRAIVIFGGLTGAGDLIMDPIKESLNENVLPIWKNKVDVIKSKLPESDAAILGASALAWVEE